MATRSPGSSAAAAHDPPDGLAEEQIGALDRRVRGEHEARHVDALADHVHRDQPARRARVAAREAVDPGVRLRLVADHHDRLLARDRAQQRSRRARVRAVVAQHEPGGVRDHGARLEQQRVGVAQHLRQQRRRRVDRGPQPARVVGRIELVGERGDRLLRVHAPAQRRVEQPERERPADAVARPRRRSRRRSPARSSGPRRSARTGSPGRRTGTACPTARADGARRRTRRAARCPRSPTRRRGGSRRAPRTSAARDGARTGPAPRRPAGR